MVTCSVCGQEAALKHGAPWCVPCEAWIVDGTLVIDLRANAKVEAADLTR